MGNKPLCFGLCLTNNILPDQVDTLLLSNYDSIYTKTDTDNQLVSSSFNVKDFFKNGTFITTMGEYA